jgi:hypothetical protein
MFFTVHARFGSSVPVPALIPRDSAYLVAKAGARHCLSQISLSQSAATTNETRVALGDPFDDLRSNSI